MKKVTILLVMLIVGLAICGCQELDPNFEIEICNKSIERLSTKDLFRYINGDTVMFEVMTDTNTLSHANTTIKSFSDLGEILAVKYQDEVYVIVAKPVMISGEYTVSIEEIKKSKSSNGLSLWIAAKPIETSSNKSTTMIECYPFTIVKTDLKELPEIMVVYWLKNETP